MNTLAKIALTLSLLFTTSETAIPAYISVYESKNIGGQYSASREIYVSDYKAVVELGDNLTKIANKFNKLNRDSQHPSPKKITPKNLAKVNDINNPNLIFPGQTIYYRMSHNFQPKKTYNSGNTGDTY
jgi:hypothetical protein